MDSSYDNEEIFYVIATRELDYGHGHWHLDHCGQYPRCPSKSLRLVMAKHFQNVFEHLLKDLAHMVLQDTTSSGSNRDPP